MNQIKKICNFMSSNIAIFIIIFSVIAFLYPRGFSWATNYTTLFLGAAMFGMGLTIKTQDFRVVFTRPRELCIGFVLQYTVMPLTAYVLAKAFGLPADLALGVILVGCCPGGTASGDVPLSVGMTIVSTILAPVCTPVLVYLLAGSWVEVSLLTMMMSVVRVVLVPVLLGILIYRIFPKQIDAVRELLPMISVIAIVMIISGIVGSNAEKIVSCGALVMVVVVGGSSGGGIEVGMQNSGLAISLATANFAVNPLATLPGAVFSVWHNISGTIYAGIRRSSGSGLISHRIFRQRKI